MQTNKLQSKQAGIGLKQKKKRKRKKERKKEKDAKRSVHSRANRVSQKIVQSLQTSNSSSAARQKMKIKEIHLIHLLQPPKRLPINLPHIRMQRPQIELPPKQQLIHRVHSRQWLRPSPRARILNNRHHIRHPKVVLRDHWTRSVRLRSGCRPGR